MADGRRPGLSVVMSVYDGDRFLRASVDSVLAQDMDDLELVVVDDGSRDATAELLRALGDPRVRVLTSPENRGQARALNLGIEAARADLIARQDADDISEPARLRRQAGYLTDHPEVGLVGCAADVIDERGRVLGRVGLDETDHDLGGALLEANRLVHGTVMFRRTAWEAAGGYRELETCQDYDLWLRMAERWRVASLGEPLYRWRLTSSSVSVRRAALQLAYIAFVQELARERRARGSDSFVPGLRPAAPPSPWGFAARPEAVARLVVAGRLARYGRRARAAMLTVRAVLADPWNARLWRFLAARAFSRGTGSVDPRVPGAGPGSAQGARRSVLYLSCWSLREPTCQRLCLPSLHVLARDGWQVHLLTFERPPFRGAAPDARRWRDELAADGIVWHPVRYHHRPLLFAKAWDGLVAAWRSWRIVRRARPALVHARSEFPALVAAVVSRLGAGPLLYESDALISEERLAAGVWRRGSFVERVTRAVERWLPRAAAEMIVLTEPYANRLRSSGVPTPVTVVPSCTDVTRFQPRPEARQRLRRGAGLEGKFVVAYVGKVTGGPYWFEPMCRFVARLRARWPEAHWLCLVNEPSADVVALAAEHGLESSALTVLTVPPEDMPDWLAASDLALSFIKPNPFSSPTKVAEYLAAGLPVVLTAGVGDCDRVGDDPDVGHVLRGVDDAALDEAVRWVEGIRERSALASAKARRFAVERLSVQDVAVPAYRRLYDRLEARRAA